MNEVAVVLAAAEPMFRMGMRIACQREGIAVAAEAADHRALAAIARKLTRRRVIVSEAPLLEPDSIGAVHALSARHHMLVVEDRGLPRAQLLRAGASGFLSRPVHPRALCDAVHLAHAGELVVTERAAPDIEGSPRPRRVLTQREVDVLRLIAAGSTTDTAARQLHLSGATVKTHLRNASEKLGTRSRAAAVAKAATLGLLD